MTDALMAEPKKGRPGRKSPPGGEGQEARGSPELGGVTAVKVYEAMRDMLSQIASLTKQNQQDAMMRYWKVMEDDLLVLLAKRQRELQRGGQDGG